MEVCSSSSRASMDEDEGHAEVEEEEEEEEYVDNETTAKDDDDGEKASDNEANFLSDESSVSSVNGQPSGPRKSNRHNDWRWTEDDPSSWTPFLQSCEAGNVGEMRRLLEETPHCIGDTSNRGRNGLHIAARFGEPDAIELLLQRYPELLESRDVEGFTPLLESIKSRKLGNTEYLIKRGADINAINIKTQNIFMVAAIANNLDVFKMLIK